MALFPKQRLVYFDLTPSLRCQHHESSQHNSTLFSNLTKWPLLHLIFRPRASKSQTRSTSPNFGFDDLRDRMNKFTLRFDAFIERERKRILDERNKFRMDVFEVQGDMPHFISKPC